MAEPVACIHARAMHRFDALSSAIAGFALLTGSRLFAFAALVSLRSPVLGAAALVLLAVVGWMRWAWLLRAQSGPETAPVPCRPCPAALSRNNRNDRLL
jgi:hypothetical protein